MLELENQYMLICNDKDNFFWIYALTENSKTKPIACPFYGSVSAMDNIF